MNITKIHPLLYVKTAVFMLIVLLTTWISMLNSTASASAYGCSFGHPTYGPSQYCVYLRGSGRYVDYVKTSFRGSAFACNYRTTAEFFDSSWRWYKTYSTGTSSGCGTGADARINVYANMKSGYMCSTLHYSRSDRESANRRMSVCHRIY